MCGIFGLTITSSLKIMFKDVISDLFLASSSRGRDASGLCISDTRKIYIYKDAKDAMSFIEDKNYLRLLQNIKTVETPNIIIGHTRAETKGDHRYNINNHPIKTGSVVGVHNGIISNDDALFQLNKDSFQRTGRVDSEIIFRLLNHYLEKQSTIVEAVQKTSNKLVGSYACAFTTTKAPRYLTLFTNSRQSPLVVYNNRFNNWSMFGSTEAILDSSINNKSWIDKNDIKTIKMLNCGLRIDCKTGKMFKFDL